MADFLSDIKDFFSGRSSIPPNPDPTYNVRLLKVTRKKIESGIFTQLFKRPTVYILETITYLVTIFLFVAALKIWGKLDSLFDTAEIINFVSKFTSNTDLGIDEYSWISYVILGILMIPAFIAFLLSRLFTQSRKRTAILIQVENMIDRVIFNLEKPKVEVEV